MRPFNQFGGLTLVPMPGFEPLATEMATEITNISERDNHFGTSVDIAKPIFGCHANGEPYLKLGKTHIGGHDCVVLTSGPGTPEMLIRTYILLKYLAGRRASRILLVTAYLPLSRSDKDEGGETLALLPMIIDLFVTGGKQQKGQEQKMDRLICFDMHSGQGVMAGGTGLITEVSMIRRVLERAISDASKVTDKICLSFPDDSAQKREMVAEAIQANCNRFERSFPEVYGAKRRTSSTNSRQKHVFGDLEALQDAIVICIDDEIATGGTNIENAKHLKAPDFGASQVWAAVTHGVLCGEAYNKLSLPNCALDRLYFADTIPTAGRTEIAKLIEEEKIIPVPIAHDLAEIIYRHHWSLSIRELM